MTWLKKLSRLRLNLRKFLVGIVLASCLLMFMRTLTVSQRVNRVPEHVLASYRKLEAKDRQGKAQLNRATKFQKDFKLRDRHVLTESDSVGQVDALNKQRDDHGHFIVDNMVKDPVNQYLHQHHAAVIKNDSHADNTTCLDWVRRAPKPPYFLTAVLLFRIYKEDKAKLTTREMKEWLQYLRYAGIEHVYVYDAWVFENESQQSALQVFQEDGYTTYIDWHTHNPYTISGTQVAAYQHCIDQYAHENHWQAAIDIDEYPFSPQDTTPGFLYRYMKDFSDYHPQVSEITMQNYLYLGKPLEKELLIERLVRRTHHPANPLVKPIYKPSNVRAQVHHNSLRKGRSMNAPSAELRMNHYWGARLQNWGEDTPDIIEKTEPDYNIEPIIRAFKKCEVHIRHYLE